MRLVPRTVVAAARLRGVQALVAVVAALVAAACLAPSAAVRWGLGAALGAALAAVLGAVYLQPTFATDLVERHEPRVVWRARTKRPVAALTIDDVPNYGQSRLEEILSILREHGARATLFVMSACLAAWVSNLQPDFNVSECDLFAARSSAVLREFATSQLTG